MADRRARDAEAGRQFGLPDALSRHQGAVDNRRHQTLVNQVDKDRRAGQGFYQIGTLSIMRLVYRVYVGMIEIVTLKSVEDHLGTSIYPAI